MFLTCNLLVGHTLLMSVAEHLPHAYVQADLCRLPQNLVRFDAVLAVNVLERLPNPALFLDQLSGLVQANGVVVLASAFAWSEHDTPKENWLGGFYKVCTCFGLGVASDLAGSVIHCLMVTAVDGTV